MNFITNLFWFFINNNDNETSLFNERLKEGIPRKPALLYKAVLKDILSGSKYFLNKNVTIKAKVRRSNIVNKGYEDIEYLNFIELKTLKEGWEPTRPGFLIYIKDNPLLLAQYKKDRAYIFNITITDIRNVTIGKSYSSSFYLIASQLLDENPKKLFHKRGNIQKIIE